MKYHIPRDRIRMCRNCGTTARNGEQFCPGCGGDRWMKIDRLTAVCISADLIMQAQAIPAGSIG